MAPQEKLRGFMLAVEVLKYAYAEIANSSEKAKIKELYNQFIDKFGFSEGIKFEAAISAISAFDDPKEASQQEKNDLEKVKGLIK